MGWDDESDDGDFMPPLPPEDRLWRHPSELAALGSFSVPAVVPRRPRPWMLAVASATVGALTVGAVWAVLDTAPASLTRTTVVVRESGPLPRLVSAPGWAATAGTAAASALVEVRTANGSGTGFVLADRTVVVAASSVIGGSTAVVVGADGRSDLVDVVAVDESRGIAFLVTGAGTPVTTDPALTIERGDWVAVLGAAATPLAATVVTPSASSIGTAGAPVHGLVELDVTLDEGQLGSAVVNDSGAVVGIVVAVEDHAFALPIGSVVRALDSFTRYGSIRSAWLGVESTDASDGARLRGVDPSGPGHLSGLAPGDVIVRFDGVPVRSAAELAVAVRDRSPGDAVSVTVRRGDQELLMEILLALRTD